MSIQPIEEEAIESFYENAADSIRKKLQLTITVANAIEVTDQDSFKRMGDLYAESREWEKRIEFMRKEANGPDQERINSRNDTAKKVLVPLKQLQEIAKHKCSQYQLILERERIDEEKKIQDAIDLLGLDEVTLPVTMQKTVTGDKSLMYTRVVRKFRTTDLSKVPLDYLQINEEKICKAIKLGIDNIPGIEIYEEKQTTLKKR